MSAIINLSRRDFLRIGSLAGGGLLLGYYLPGQVFSSEALANDLPYDPAAFLRIGADETITMIINKSEMGQGVYTSIPMLIAEELECDWHKIRVEPAPVNPIYNGLSGAQMTGGSSSIRTEWDRMRKVGAAARMMLIGAAAKLWNVKASNCRAENGRVVQPGGEALTYGQLAEKAASMSVPQNIVLKDPSAFKIVGKPMPRIDSPEKVNGKGIFGFDVTSPGMLVALVARPPVFGGTAKSFDATKTKEVPGVRDVVQIDSGIAVVADNFWAAKRGQAELQVVWNDGEWASLSTDAIRAQYAGLAKTAGVPARNDGDPDKAAASASKQVSADYELPYLAHADMEPLNCLVDLRADGCDVWTGTQVQTSTRDVTAKITGLDPNKIKVHTTLLGGGFGRRANPHSDFIVMAVQVAKAIRKPVKVIWTREDDIKGGWYRPLYHHRLNAGLDADGNLISWRHTIVGQSIMAGTLMAKIRIGMKGGIDPSSVEGATDIPYEIPNILVDLHTTENGVPVQWWRSVGHSHTCFAVESFIDEVAHEAEKDPYQFRRALLANHPRHRGALDLAAQKAGWGQALPKDRARGIAMMESYGSFISQVAEVSVDTHGLVRVHRVVCAVDCGQNVNPLTIEAQMESAIVFGLSAALYGAVILDSGRVQQSNFDNYRVLRMDKMPAIEVHIVQNQENPGGIGEPGTPPIAPAVANAVFALTGERKRRLPIENTIIDYSS